MLLGIGDDVLEDYDPESVVTMLKSDDPANIRCQLFRRLARSAGNEWEPLVEYASRPRAPVSRDALVEVSCPVLIVRAERDDGAEPTRLAASLPRGAGGRHTGH